MDHIRFSGAKVHQQERANGRPDYKKSVRMVTVGTFVVAPLVFTWMFLAERMFPGRAIKTVAKKMITDQVVFAPVAISTFYFSKLI